MARQVNTGQGQRGEGPVGILGQAPVAYFRKAPQALDHGKHMFDPRSDFGFVAILCPFGFIDLAGSA